MRTKFFDLALRFQIIIPFSVLIIALAVVAVGFGLPLANKSASENVDLKLDNARSFFLLLLDHETGELNRSTALLVEREELAAALAAGDTEALSEMLKVAPWESLDALQVTDVEGTTLIGAAGATPPCRPRLWFALAGRAPAMGVVLSSPRGWGTCWWS